MATRMQQRRGTAQQWTDADPRLESGEIGFETDTNQFKIGDGVNVWSDLSYFKNLEDLGGSLDDYALANLIGASNGIASLDSTGNVPLSQLANIIDGAPELLNTINELAAAIDDNAGFANTVLYSVDAAQSAAEAHAEEFTTNAIASEVAARDTAIGNHNQETTNVHGIANTAALALSADVATSIGTATQNITTAYTDAISNLAANVLSDYTDAISAHGSDTSNVHGIADTTALATMTYAQNVATAAQGNAEATASSELSSHNSTTLNVHGIANTAALATQTYADTAADDALMAAGISAEGKIANAVAALTKSSVGLGNVDNTADADKPVSTATQTALDLKANLAGPTFTGTVTANNLVVDGDLTLNGNTFNASATTITIEDNMLQLAHQNAANTVDLGLVVAYNDGTAKHSGLVRDVSDAKWKLFQGVTTEPTTTVNFAQGSLDALAVGALEATTVTPSSGIVFSDGTQTKLGVPSVTTFATAISSSATLATGEADKFVPLTGAVTITLPATGYVTGQSIDFYQASGTGAQFASTNSVVGTPGLKFRTTNSVVTAMKTSSGWLVFGDLSA